MSQHNETDMMADRILLFYEDYLAKLKAVVERMEQRARADPVVRAIYAQHGVVFKD